jgi:hypothetical protein
VVAEHREGVVDIYWRRLKIASNFTSRYLRFQGVISETKWIASRTAFLCENGDFRLDPMLCGDLIGWYQTAKDAPDERWKPKIHEDKGGSNANNSILKIRFTVSGVDASLLNPVTFPIPVSHSGVF